MSSRAATAILLALLALAGAACSSGKDGGPCGAGQVLCGGCYDPAQYQTDPNNCGGCGVACGAGVACVGGACQCAAAGLSLCSQLSPRCRDLNKDSGACGSCTTTCTKPGSNCQGGTCGCFANPDPCGSICTNFQTDPANCSACANACPLPNESCVSGACACAGDFPTGCPTGAPTACVNLTNDASNCGACGTQCSSSALNSICVSSACTCPATLPTACPAAGNTPARCVNLDTDPRDCGACGTVCAQGATCVAGTPIAHCQCPAGEAVCGAACVPCPTGARCQPGGFCGCPAGPTPGCGGQCCDGGQTCCANGACQTKHSNGLGGFYFDCNPLYAPSQTTQQAATAAADTWPPGAGGTTIPGACQPFCIGRRTANQAQCAVWCYAGSTFAGLVGLNASNGACLCPGVAAQTNPWN